MNSSGVCRWNSGVNDATSVSATPASASSSSRRSRVVMRSTRFPIAIRGWGSNVITVGVEAASRRAIQGRIDDRDGRRRTCRSRPPAAGARAARVRARSSPARAAASRGSASSRASTRSSSASSTENGPISVRRSADAVAAERGPRSSGRTCPSRRGGRAPRSRRRTTTSSSSWTRITRVGISTATPFRWRRYALSPSIFTAEAAGIGSSTSPRRSSSASLELVVTQVAPGSRRRLPRGRRSSSAP